MKSLSWGVSHPRNFDSVHTLTLSLIDRENIQMVDDVLSFLGISAGKTLLQSMGGTVVLHNGDECVIRTYVTNFLAATTPLPAFLMDNVQRKIDWERVDKMFHLQEAEFEKRKRFGIASTMITLGHCKELKSPTNPFGLKFIDGQHRRGVWENLQKFHKEKLICVEILIKICVYENYTHMIEDFQVINDNWIPVSQYYLKSRTKEVVDGVILWINRTLDHSLFRPAANPQRPHLNWDRIKEKLADHSRISDLILECDGNTEKSIRLICQKIVRYNTRLQTYTPIQFKEKSRDDLHMIEARMRECARVPKPTFLGMFGNCSWIDHALDPLVNPDEDEGEGEGEIDDR